MNPVELHLIEKRFVKLSLDKNYITGMKEISYGYLNKEDYAWHKKRLESTGWKEESSTKDVVLAVDDARIKVLVVNYKKVEIPDWKKKQRARERKMQEKDGVKNNPLYK